MPHLQLNSHGALVLNSNGSLAYDDHCCCVEQPPSPVLCCVSAANTGAIMVTFSGDGPLCGLSFLLIVAGVGPPWSSWSSTNIYPVSEGDTGCDCLNALIYSEDLPPAFAYVEIGVLCGVAGYEMSIDVGISGGGVAGYVFNFDHATPPVILSCDPFTVIMDGFTLAANTTGFDCFDNVDFVATLTLPAP